MRERETRILLHGMVEDHIAVTGERGENRVHLRQCKLLPDASPRAEPEWQQRTLLARSHRQMARRIERERVGPHLRVAVQRRVGRR